jgi:hypothetical protein
MPSRMRSSRKLTAALKRLTIPCQHAIRVIEASRETGHADPVRTLRQLQSGMELLQICHSRLQTLQSGPQGLVEGTESGLDELMHLQLNRLQLVIDGLAEVETHLQARREDILPKIDAARQAQRVRKLYGG